MQTPQPQSLEVPQEMLSPAAKRLKAVQEEILAKRAAERNKPVYVPPPPPPQIAEQTRLEQEEGRRRNEMANAQAAKRPVPKLEPDATVHVPVYRPVDFVPNMNQGQVATKSYKAL